MLVLGDVLAFRFTPSGPSLYDNGEFGDADGDGAVDCVDLSILSTAGLSFDGSEILGTPMYDVIYDAEVNHALDKRDLEHLVAKMLPGDIATPMVTALGKPDLNNPDFELTRYDGLAFMSRVSLGIRGAMLGQQDYSLVVTGIDTVGDSWVSGGAYVPPDGQYTLADIQYTIEAWQNQCAGALSTSSLLGFDFADLNSDGRINHLDLQVMEAMLNGGGYDPDLDFSANGSINAGDVNFFLEIVLNGSPFGQGIFADFDGSASPSCVNPTGGFDYLACETNIDAEADCDDLLAMKALGATWITDLFDSGLIYGDAGFVIQLDANLDGILDSTDQQAVLRHLQPADFTNDGELDIFDVLAFIAEFNAGSLEADFTDDGVLDIFDVLAFIAAHENECSSE